MADKMMGVSIRAGQDVDPFVELKVGDLLHPSLEGYIFVPTMIDDLICALQAWQQIKSWNVATEHEIFFISQGID